MRIKLPLFILNLLCSCLLFSQNTIEGTISSSKGEDIFYATVILFDSANNGYVAAVTSDEQGAFTLENIKDGDFYLIIKMLGYKDLKQENISLPEDNKKPIKIVLEEDATLLDEVVVKGKVPLMEQKADRLVVNVENSLIGSGGSMIDAMKSVPGVLVTNRGIRIAGQSNVTILINGRSTQYMNINSLLQDMPASSIKRIELIHQPGAEFDASGTGPIINIILKKNNLLGTNGSASLRLEKDYKWLYWTGLSLSHYKKDLNIAGYIGYSHTAAQEGLEVTRRVKNDIYKQNSFNPNDGNTFGTNLSLDYDISEKQRIGIGAQYWRGITDQVKTSSTDIDFEDPQSDLSLTTRNIKDGDWSYLNLSPYYSLTFDTASHKLDIDVNLFGLKSDATNTLENSNITTPSSFFAGQRFIQPNDNKIAAVRLDYAKPLSPGIQLNTGLKFSRADLENDLIVFQEASEGVWMLDPSQSNLFIFNEDIAAVYGKLTTSLGAWSGTLGLRYEYSNSEGTSKTIDESISRKISKLFPSFSLRRDIAGPIATSFAYSYRIDRPRYYDLNPFITNLDPFTGERGNTVLTPALTHSMKLNVLYDNFPFLSAEYKIIDDAMVQVTEQNDSTGVTFLSTVNLEKQRLFNIQLLAPIEFFVKDVSGSVGFIVNHNEYESEYLGQRFDRSKWTYTAFLQARVKLPAGFNAEARGSYSSGALDGVIELEDFYRVELALSKKFWNDRAEVTFGIDDVIYRFRNGEIKYANADINFTDSWYVNEISFGFSYKFGNRYLNSRKNRDKSAKEEIDRTKK